MKKKFSFIGLIAFLLGVLALPVNAAVSGNPSSPTSDAGIVPYVIAGENRGGNRTCDEVGLAFFGEADYYELKTGKIDYEGGFDGSFDPIAVSTDGTHVSWSYANHIGLAAIVKGSAEANIYVYDGSYTYDSGLASPLNSSGNPAGLSNLTFCWNPKPVKEEPQWCSPGYWRQPHHLASWEATGISPNGKYSSYFGILTISKKAIRDGATTDPTLLQVLQSPQWYGGEAFNNVGDLLSEAHPDVNYIGERTEDSCPLGR